MIQFIFDILAVNEQCDDFLLFDGFRLKDGDQELNLDSFLYESECDNNTSDPSCWDDLRQSRYNINENVNNDEQ